MVGGWVGGELIGYAFGTPYGRPKAVWDKAVPGFATLGSATTADPVYIFREFAVHPLMQGKGYARRIHDALLAERPEPLAYLLVRAGNPARDAYESWGWRVIGQTRPFPDSPIMDEMAKLLSAQTVSGREGTG